MLLLVEVGRLYIDCAGIARVVFSCCKCVRLAIVLLCTVLTPKGSADGNGTM